ncbi:MAG: hypothetical protein HY871_00290 [Chloroflexi bacterium]|nr:hypothetical protein [Chloroflexota bacterium]
MPSKNAVYLIIGLLLLGALVIYLAAFVLPERNVQGFWRLREERIERATPPTPGAGVPVPGAWRAERGARVSDFWLLPFGLHHRGVEGIWWYLASFAVLAAMTVTVALLFPDRVHVLAESMQGGRQLAANLAVGLLGYLFFVLVGFLLVINIIGLPLVLLVVVILYSLSVLGVVAVSLAVGHGVARMARLGAESALFDLLVGLVLVFLASVIPYLGWLVIGIVLALGLGAVLRTRFGRGTGWSLEEL